MVMIDQSNNYWVEVTDDKGCTKRDTVKVTIKNCEQCELFVPSAFTPYKNGLNDLFKATPQCSSINYDSYTMKIYNRWGQPVFASNNVHTGWDGTLKNKSLPQGVYVYFIKYKYKGDKYLVKKGTVLLIR
jgi:gliding motility-associated-like protein